MTDIDLTGPAYPRPPGPGSNALGKFVLGVSSLGTIPSFDWWKTIISQFANSTEITALIESLFDCLDQTKNFDNFFDLVMNVDTAEDYGLDVWGRIVGVNRVVKVPIGDWFGFAQGRPGSEPFGQAPFYSGQPLTNNFRLGTEAYRFLIIAKAAANITNGSIQAINRILMNLFPNRGNAYVTENPPTGDFFGFAQGLPDSRTFNVGIFYAGESFPRMLMTYTFEFQLSPVELAIVQNSGVLPKSTGVLASVVLK